MSSSRLFVQYQSETGYIVGASAQISGMNDVGS